MSDVADQGLEQLVRQLIDRQSESRSLDYKAAMAFGPTKVDKAELLKCFMAFANTRDGGYVLVGVEQQDGKFVPTGVSAAQAKSFDPTDLGAFAKNYCSVQPVVSTHVVTVDDLDLVLLQIAEFDDEPIVCTKDLHDVTGKNLVLRAGSIYVRTADARCVAIESGEAMRAFLDLAIQKRGDALLHQIRRLVGAPGPGEGAQRTEPYEAERNDAEGLFARERIDEPYWYVEIMPGQYNAKRVSNNARLQEIRREAAVSIRGWDFPHTDREHNHAFEHGIESVTNWSRYHEAHRLYRSGLFTWRRQLAEDSSEQYTGAISYVSSIYSLTEFFLFATRYMSLVADEGDVIMRLGVTGLNSRVLRAEPDVLLDDYGTAAQRFDYPVELPIEQLRASHLDLANEAARELFELFNLNVAAETITGWQTKFIERRF